MTISILIIGLITGTMIGSIGVGGVLLAPFLFYGIGLDLHLATALRSWSFLFTGIVGTFMYWRKGSISWNVIAWLTIGIIPGAIIGARLNIALSTYYLIIVLAILLLISGLNTLLSKSKGKSTISTIPKGILVLLGLITGFGSALTGTGGPVVLVPILMFMNIQALPAIAASQVAQIPIAVSAAVAFNFLEQTNLMMATSLGIIQSAGVILGARFAHALKAEEIRRILAIALLSVSFIMILRILF